MPTIQRGDATIYYEERGSGPPLLLLAPGGLNSTVDFWGRMPLNPLEAFSNDFRVIAMDQRNAGRSSGPLDTSDPWHMYADDQLAVLDHLGVDQATVIGCCIGCSFVFQLLEQAPGRIRAGVLMQPIGDDHTNAGVFGPEMWRPWGQNLIDHELIFVGLIPGFICCYAVNLKNRFDFDDSLDVVGVHLVGGILGSLLLGLFADKAVNGAGANGLFFGGGLHLLGEQFIAVVSVLAFTFVVSWIIAKVVDATVGLRCTPDEELEGLDLTQHAEAAYSFGELGSIGRI